MTMQASVAPVRASITVDVPIARAFEVFTDGFDSWWPRSHHIGGPDLQRAVIEPRAGGRWYELGEDGTECDWGRVLAWEPPGRVVLSWQITPSWGVEPDPAKASEVEVRFSAQGEGRTLVELEHRHLERHGEGVEGMREQIAGDGGWRGLLGMFAEAAAR